MTVNITTSLGAGIVRTLSDQNAKATAVKTADAVSSAASSSADSASQTSFGEAVTTSASAPEPQAISLRIDAISVAYVGSKLDELNSSAVEVGRILDQLQSIATSASAAGLSDSARELLNGQFQALRISINNVPPQPPGTDYKASALLDTLGSASAVNATDSGLSDVVVGGFTDTAFLGAADQTNLLTQSSAQAAVTTVDGAFAKLDAQQTNISQLQDVVSLSSASVESGLQNQEAQHATLSESDLQQAQNSSSLVATLAQAQNALQVQTGRLPNNVLQLLV